MSALAKHAGEALMGHTGGAEISKNFHFSKDEKACEACLHLFSSITESC